MSPADQGAAGISASPGDEGGSTPAGPGRDRHDAGPRGCPGRATQSGVLEDAGSDTDDIQQEPDEAGPPGDVDEELAALKAEIGPGSSAPPELAGS